MKLRYTPAAIADLEEIKSYIADTLLNPDAAANLMASIAAACALLKDQPLLGPELRHKLHREIDERFLIHKKYMINHSVLFKLHGIFSSRSPAGKSSLRTAMTSGKSRL